jgi:hypothetical protein
MCLLDMCIHNWLGAENHLLSFTGDNLHHQDVCKICHSTLVESQLLPHILDLEDRISNRSGNQFRVSLIYCYWAEGVEEGLSHHIEEVCGIINGINHDMTMLSQHMDHCHCEINTINGEVNSLLQRPQELEERIMTLGDANVEKEGHIDMLESLVDSISNQLCHCANKGSQVESGSGSKEDLYTLQYKCDNRSNTSYQTPPQSPGNTVLCIL